MADKKYVSISDIESVRVPMDEAETVICIARTDDNIEIFSSDNVMITKIKKAANKSADKWKCWESSRDKEGNVLGYFFSAPRKVLSFRGTERKKRVVTEEQRQKITERLQSGRRKSKKGE